MACLFDKEGECWLNFYEPVFVISTDKIVEVFAALGEIEKITRRDRLYAVGFVTYDAAPAFDSKLQAHYSNTMPLLWFALCPEPVKSKHPLGYKSSNAHWDYRWMPDTSAAQYRDAIERIKNYIEKGDTYQVNYSFRLHSVLKEPSEVFFARMIAGQGPGYGAYVNTGDWSICSASPELFFKMNGGQLISRPMKGTTHRGLTYAEDLRQAQWLKHSEKNQAENVMIVDMVRHDLSRIARKGSVQVDRLFDLEKYPTLWQMTSTVSCWTEAGLGEIFQALFPASSITGAPKSRTMEIITELETSPRRIYTGSIGYVTPERYAQFNVAIRTVLVNCRTQKAEYGVGGGVIWDSTDKDEYEECRTKAKVLNHSPPSFELLETLLWTPSEGYYLLDRHLNRLSESAAYFDRKFDSEEARTRLLDYKIPDTTCSHKVRILLDCDGRLTIQSTPFKDTVNEEPVRLQIAASPINPEDIFLYHKTTNRSLYEEAAKGCSECDEVLLWNPRGEVTESSIANVVIELNGRLFTPPGRCGLLGGTYRAQLLSDGIISERIIQVDELKTATNLYLVNSVRKWRRAALVPNCINTA